MALSRTFGPGIPSYEGQEKNQVSLKTYPDNSNHYCDEGSYLVLSTYTHDDYKDNHYYCIIKKEHSHSYNVSWSSNMCEKCIAIENNETEDEKMTICGGPRWECDNSDCTVSYSNVRVYGLYKVGSMYEMSSNLYYDIIEARYDSISSDMEIHYKDNIKYYSEYNYNNCAWYYINKDNTLMMFKIIYIPLRTENNDIVLFSSEDNFKKGIRCTKEGFKEKMNEITFLSNLSERNLTKFMKLSLCKQQRFMWWSPPDKKGYRDSKSRRKLLFIVMMCAYKASEESKVLSLRSKQEKTYSHVTQKYPSTVGLFVPVTEQYSYNMFLGGLEILDPYIWNRIFSFLKHDYMPKQIKK
jgi:hypothetical protein